MSLIFVKYETRVSKGRQSLYSLNMLAVSFSIGIKEKSTTDLINLPRLPQFYPHVNVFFISFVYSFKRYSLPVSIIYCIPL